MDLPLGYYAAAFPVLSFFLYGVYTLYLHPLAGVPGPWYAAFGNVWSEWSQFCLHFSRDIDGLHKRYGPVVRIAQNSVVFVDEQAQKAVYGNGSKMAREKYYKRFKTGGGDHSMTLLGHTEWSNRRKAVAPHYTTMNLALFEQDIEKYTLQMLDGLIARGENGTVAFDLMSVFRHLLVDIVHVVSFDMDNGTVAKWSRGEVDQLDLAVTDFPKFALVCGLFPPFIRSIISTTLSLFSTRLRGFFQSDNRLHAAAKRIYDHYLNDPESFASGEKRKSLIQRMMEYRYVGEEESGRGVLVKGSGGMRRMREDEVLSESQAHLIAGSETTATTGAMMIWLLASNPGVLQKVRDEVDHNVAEHTVAAWNVLNGAAGTMDYFNGFIKEGLRLYAIIPGPLPRVLHIPLTIQGHTIPAGTMVATQSWSLHRQPGVFEDPTALKPERWVGKDKETVERMNANFIPFGVGPRACSGQNLAQIMLRIMISTLVRHFDFTPAPGTNKDTMMIWESFALFPKALEAKYYLKPRAH